MTGFLSRRNVMIVYADVNQREGKSNQICLQHRVVLDQLTEANVESRSMTKMLIMIAHKTFLIVNYRTAIIKNGNIGMPSVDFAFRMLLKMNTGLRICTIVNIIAI